MEYPFAVAAVPSEQAAETLLNALAFRGVLAERQTCERGLQVVLQSGLRVGIEGGCYSWPVGRGLQIHPVDNPEGAATLIAEQENDPVWRRNRRYPGWLIMQCRRTGTRRWPAQEGRLTAAESMHSRRAFHPRSFTTSPLISSLSSS
jgi:hypothetical protein